MNTPTGQGAAILVLVNMIPQLPGGTEEQMAVVVMAVIVLMLLLNVRPKQ